MTVFVSNWPDPRGAHRRRWSCSLLLCLSTLLWTACATRPSPAAPPDLSESEPAAPTLLRNQGDEVVVVFNSKVPQSREVARHYADRRAVPARNVVGWPLPTAETCSRTEFMDLLRNPLLAFLRSLADPAVPSATNNAGLPLRIRHVVLCYGVPVRISASLPRSASDGGLPSQNRRDEAAVDSELALLPLLPTSSSFGGSLANPVYGQTNGAAISPAAGVLIVTRLDGPTAEIARGLVDKAMAAETNGLWGRAYFDLRGITNTGGYQIGDLWMRTAANATRAAGFETTIDDRPATFPPGLPLPQVAFYAGWYDGKVSGPFAQPTVEFVPGALGYHLHSFSARLLRTSTNFWAGPLLARGVTATLGYVEEPYLHETVDVGILWSRLIQSGFSFGEAACAAQRTLSWQTTVIGDPLYRPFGRRLPGAPVGEHFRNLHGILERRQDPLLAWTHLHVVNVGLATGLGTNEAIRYLTDLPAAATNSILLEKLGDLHESQGNLPRATDAHLQALKHPTTPQQRTRLLLQVARRQALGTENRPALETYERFLHDFPEYPDRVGVLQRMLPLAQKLGDTNRIPALERELQRLQSRP